jgi:hypothetical protein
MSGKSVGLGAGPTNLVIMDPLAWGLFKARLKERGELPQLFQYDRSSTSRIEIGPSLQNKIERKGTVGEYEIVVYQDTYRDDAGATQKIIPDNTVIGVGPPRTSRARAITA